MVVSPGIPEFFHSDSTSFNARLQPNESGGTPVLVVKSKSDTKKAWPALGVLARGALSLMGRGGAKAAAGKGAQVGVKGAAGTAGAAGGAAATMPKPPAGSATTTLQPSQATSGSSMASQSSAKGASQPNVQTNTPNENIFDKPLEEAQYQDAMRESGMNPVDESKVPTKRARSKPAAEMTEGQTTLKPHDPTLRTAVEESRERQVAAHGKKIGVLEGQVDAGKKFGGAALAYEVGGRLQQRRASKDAEQRAEMERIERLAQDGRAKAGTGSKVAVSS